MNQKFGSDIGGVLVPLIFGSHRKTFDEEAFKKRQPRENAFSVLAKLAETVFGPSNIYLVSYCGLETERKTRVWLDHQGFHEITNIPVSNLYFCRDRAHKNPICAKLGITEFVDDRMPILQSLETVPTRFWFNPKEDEVSSDPNIRTVHNWTEIAQCYL